MASEWEMAMGVELGMGMRTYHHNSSSITTAPMSSHHSGGGSFSTAHHYYYGMPPMGDTMPVDDLLDLPNGAGAHEFFPAAAAAAATDNGHHSGAMGEPSPTANSSDHQTSLLSFADEFYIPSEEAAELEWLSKFVDDSYSDMPNNSSAAQAAMAAAAVANAACNGAGNSAGQDICVTAAPGRGARSKRSRATAAAAAAWHSLVPRPASQTSPSSSCSSSDFQSSKPARPNGSNGSRGKKSPVPGGAAGEAGMEAGVRRCTHCASEKTPQWRTGPLGPKTLCNACGVRFKSGRLMPEYRPAASPTFVLTQHSNSHRKVMELRRQKELILVRGSHRDAAAAAAALAATGSAGPRPELMFRDYGVC
ncbi:GATA transcription factor 4-like [Phragmites australis]|uniref:GATA transcription factor 4-like n=1 Tax=Phragmites australis TaxID=29695 RepID=UPI002D769041|nr:GATA transcription factor 4-like [Phragmites australis]